ncbi:MAG: hypothetical protein Q8N22_00950 [bacterium]|nr:hypothetical protein [bacterium]
MSINIDKDYLNIIKERKKTSRVYEKFQFTGLTIAQILGDEKHKSLYIKMAKKHDEHKLITTAKSVAERKNIENKGAYFMKVFYQEIKNSKK